MTTGGSEWVYGPQAQQLELYPGVQDPGSGPKCVGLCATRGDKPNNPGTIAVLSGYSLEAPHVLLVDDVLTTGATCSEAARVLKRGGAKRVSVLVVARTPT